VPFLTGEVAESPREEYFYFRRGLEAVRVGDWKLRTRGGIELFNMRNDPFERFNRAEDKPEIVSRLKQRMKEMASEVGTEVRGVD